VPLYSAIGGGSPLTWSISTEWFFYLAYPVVAFLVLRAHKPAMTVLMIVVWCGLWIALASGLYERSGMLDAWGAVRWPLDGAPAQNQTDTFSRWLLYLSPYVRIGEFVLGCLVAELYLQLSTRSAAVGERAFGLVLLMLAFLSVPVITYFNYDPAVGTAFFRRLNTNFALAPTSAIIVFAVARWRTPVKPTVHRARRSQLLDLSDPLRRLHGDRADPCRAADRARPQPGDRDHTIFGNSCCDLRGVDDLLRRCRGAGTPVAKGSLEPAGIGRPPPAGLCRRRRPGRSRSRRRARRSGAVSRSAGKRSERPGRRGSI
jgi:hypothetical protein